MGSEMCIRDSRSPIQIPSGVLWISGRPTRGVLMCSPVRCARCGKITWIERGMHVDSLMGNVQPAQRCDCADRSAVRAVGAYPRWVW